MRLSRRSFLALSGLGVLTTATGVSAARDTFNLEMTHTVIPLPSLPPEFEGYRIGLLSDIHLGVYIPDEFVADAVAQLAKSQVDLVILGGDYIWLQESLLSRTYGEHFRNPRYAGSPSIELAKKIFHDVADIVTQLAPRDGTYAVMGNHDAWVDPRLCIEQFTQHGVHFLVNQEAEVVRGDARLSIFGTDDLWNGIPRLLTRKLARPNEVRMLLTHNPDFASFTLDHTEFQFDFALSGHTHGGQVCFPLVGALHYNVRDHRFTQGLVAHPKGTQVFTSRGLGVVEVPWRLNCRPEVAVIELVRS